MNVVGAAMNTIRNYPRRFLGFALTMAGVNLLPYVSSRGAYATDGLETAGWPLRFYEFGGFDGRSFFNGWILAADIVIACIVAAAAAHIFRAGIRKTLQKWQTWGTPWAT